ncbi:MAG: hypothetical protein ACR2JB_07565, partial [Bryobacteraceae bacterium]
TFVPARGSSQRAAIFGFIEVALLFMFPIAVGLLIRRKSRGNAGPDCPSLPRSVPTRDIALSGVYILALIATFASGEMASRLLLDFLLALGCVAVSASLVFLSVTQSGRGQASETTIRPWWKRWEHTLLPFAVVIPMVVASLAVAANPGSWLKLVPAAALACVLMIGALALAHGARFRDAQSALAVQDARVSALKSELARERDKLQQFANGQAGPSAAVNARLALPGLQKAAARLVSNFIPGLKKFSRAADQYAAIPNTALGALTKVISPQKSPQRAERSLF